MKFEGLSNAAKIVFVIGEPMRANKSLSVYDWRKRVFIDFVEATGLDWQDYVDAFSEVSEWVFSIKKEKRGKVKCR